ncbi:Longitudinals lacking protein, isoform G, partial [Gryllus bimaculatus]
MAEPMICVAWNVHANELTTICNTMLENELCVDCTIVAEGKSLKAHRLILSTCSPFFHMLFSEQRDEHPIVIITDTLFYTLKSVIDFVYCGKTKIPANQFEEFWKLAVSLQIKGLGNSLQIDTKTDIGSIGERNVMPSPSIVNHDICKIGSLWTSEEHDSTNSLQQHPLHVPYGYIDTAKTDPSVLVEGCCDFVQSGEKMMPQHSYKRCSVQYDPDVSINPEINVKIEPLCFESEILETKNSVLSHQSTPVHIDPEGLINTETSVKIEPLFSESEISATKPSGLGHERSPQHQDFEVLIDTEISVKHEPLYSEIECLVTRNKTEYLKQDISENIKSETIDEQSPMFNHNLDQYSCSKAYMGPQDVADDETVEMNVRTASPLKQNSNVG